MTARKNVESKNEDEESIRELCAANGLNYERLTQEGLSCVRLEMFFGGYCQLTGLSYFPNLQVLCIMGQPQLTTIEGIGAVPKLKELWVCECQLQRMRGLDELKHLRRLYLYSNVIVRIDSIDHLKDLETLWLNDNRITQVEGLSGLKYLRDLNLAENMVKKIGNSMNGLENLEKLELSGNNISSFKDLTYLAKLPKLRELGLKSPSYLPSPVGLLSNYATHVLFHLPELFSLDSYDVSSKTIKDLAETTVSKKKMFYNMKAKTVERNFSEVEQKLNDLKSKLLKEPFARLHALHYAVKEVEREMKEVSQDEEGNQETDVDSDRKTPADDKSGIDPYKTKLKALKERIKKWDHHVSEVDHFHLESQNRVKQLLNDSLNKLVTELETGGNIRFQDGKPSDLWYSSCHDLVMSRFCAADYKEHNITGVSIQKVTRLHNRTLHAAFDAALAKVLDEDESVYYLPGVVRSTAYKKQIEYLFWVCDPEMPGGMTEPQRILEEGFMDAASYKQLGRDNAVPMCNSLFLADRFRIQHCIKQNKGRDLVDNCTYRTGHVVIAKTFLGQTMLCEDHSKLIDQNHWTKADSLYRPKKDHGSGNKPAMEMPSRLGEKSSCDCSGRQCEWFVFNHELVIPEYIVQFEYATRFKPRSPFACHLDAFLDNRQTTVIDETHPHDDDVLGMSPEIKPRPKHITLSDDLLLKSGQASSFSAIRVLNLHGNSLNKLRSLQSLTSLNKLIISFNELTRLDEVSHLNIEYLDASFNKLTTLDGMKNLSRLKYLDLSWNCLQNTREDISILRKHTPTLATLDLRHNAWQKLSGLRLRAIGRIKSLTKLNGLPVTEAEATAALRMAAGSRVSQVSLLALSRTDQLRPRSLSLSPVAQVLISSSRNRPDRSGEQDNLWYSKVTTLNLDGQHISKLSNLERLENLQWASFNDNDITRIEGLENCQKLEELSLDNNCITKLEGLSRLTRLKRLGLGNNYISNIDANALTNLVSLIYLSLENNQLVGLGGVSRLTALSELYLGNNCISNIREIFYLKALGQLVILDLYGNPVCGATDNYRLFVIYHMKALKALDGISIENGEGSQAKDMFGGRLTQDFVAERLGHATFNTIKELDLPHCSLRTVDLGSGEHFSNLRSINLEHNNMTSLSGLIHLRNLKVLCLNHNHIESVIPRSKSVPANVIRAKVQTSSAPSAPLATVNGDLPKAVLENLEVLHLGYNCIRDMAQLQLGRIPSLKALFLQGNDISKIEGLDGLINLRELVLDRNKIKFVHDTSFLSQWNLIELHLEENRIKELNNLHVLGNMQRLFLGMNRVQDMLELEKISNYENLIELSLVGNTVARRMLHRPLLVYRMPQIQIIDGIPVSEEERARADLYFLEQQAPTAMTATMETALPGIGNYKTQIPVKVTNMQLMQGPFYDRTFGGTLQFNEEALQEVQRGGGRKRNQREPLTSSNVNIAPKQSAPPAANTSSPNQSGYLGNSRTVAQQPYVPSSNDSDALRMKSNRGK